MKKQLLNYTLPVLAFCALTACSSNDSTSDGGQTPVAPTDPNAGKELIAFAQEGGNTSRSSTTRASLTRGDYDGETGFTLTTKIVMRIKSEDGATTRYSQAVATAAPRLTGDELTSDWCKDYGYNTPHSHVTYNSGQERYWDDAHGRASKLTVYAVAVPDVNSTAATRTDGAAIISDDILSSNGTTTDNFGTTNPNWYKITSGTENTKIKWTVNTQQTETTMKAEDLLYSNNIRSGETTNWGRYHQVWGTPTENRWNYSKEFERLEWQSQDPSNAAVTVGKFDQGHLVFYHSLSYLVINLTEGEGFDSSANTDFQWSNIPTSPTGLTQNFTLKGFPTTGILDLSVSMNGTDMWTDTHNNEIVKLKEAVSSVTGMSGKTIRTLECYVIPGTLFDGNGSNLIEFEIDNAKYYVSGTQIATAIKQHSTYVSGNEEGTKAGKKYIINLTVGKTKISNITAAVLPWETVNTQNSDADNTHFSFTFEDRNAKLNGSQASQFDIYRAARTTASFIDNVTTDGTPVTTTTYDYEWKTGYTTNNGSSEVPNKATKSAESESNIWTTDWYWENNQTWYHFRAAGSGESTPTESAAITKDTGAGDYFTMSNGAIAGSTYKDWVWGAPFTFVDNSYKIKYTVVDGFDNNVGSGSTKQIAPAIAATDDVIRMLLFHMTSQITVNLKTTTDNDKVVLQSGDTKTQVKIVRFLPAGKVRMGTGKVEAYGTRDTGTGVLMTNTGTTHEAAAASVAEELKGFTWGMIPQSLTYTEGGVTDHLGLEITTPDNNTYYIRDLSQITAAVDNISNNNLLNPYTTEKSSGVYYIDAWYPNYRYTYNITLTKKGIDKITAAILPWETVNANNINIDLEN